MNRSTKKSKRKSKLNTETNENENTMVQNLWDATKVVLRWKFTAIQAYLKKQEKSHINNLTLHLKDLENEQTKPQISRRKKMIKIKVEINELEPKKCTMKPGAGSLKRSTKLTNL